MHVPAGLTNNDRLRARMRVYMEYIYILREIERFMCVYCVLCECVCARARTIVIDRSMNPHSHTQIHTHT